MTGRIVSRTEKRICCLALFWCTVYLIGGLVLSIVVAWVLAIRPAGKVSEFTPSVRVDAAQRFETGKGGSVLILDATRTEYSVTAIGMGRSFRGWPQPVRVSESEFRSRLNAGSRFNAILDGIDRLDYESASDHTEYAVGWPARSLRCEQYLGWERDESMDDPVKALNEAMSFRGAVVLPSIVEKYELRRIVPFWPMWRGLGLNTLFFGGILAIAFGHRHVRQLRRRIRRQCVRCGYLIQDSTRCPECGKSAGPRSPAASTIPS